MLRAIRFAVFAFCVAAITAVGASRSRLTVISFGGAYQQAQHDAYMAPFSKEADVEVAEGDYNGDYAVLNTRAKAPKGSWDVVSVEAAVAERGAKEGIFRELPEAVFDGVQLLPGAREKFAAGHLVFSTVMAFDSDRFREGGRPETWADFWDRAKFPGKRALRDNPRGSLEIALLAAGGEPGRLYPLDVAKAFKKLDEIRPDLVFWQSGAQPMQLLASKSVVMSSCYNGRAWDAREKEGQAIAWSWNGGLMETEYWAIPRNARNPKNAMAFISFSLRPKQQAAFTNQIAYGPTNLAALKILPTRTLEALPNSPAALPKQIPVNARWWADNEAKLSAEWERWKSR